MGFFDDLKKEISQAVTELVSDEEMLPEESDYDAGSEKNAKESKETEYLDEDDYIETEEDYADDTPQNMGVVIDDFASDEYVNTLDIDIKELIASYSNELGGNNMQNMTGSPDSIYDNGNDMQYMPPEQNTEQQYDSSYGDGYENSYDDAAQIMNTFGYSDNMAELYGDDDVMVNTLDDGIPGEETEPSEVFAAEEYEAEEPVTEESEPEENPIQEAAPDEPAAQAEESEEPIAEENVAEEPEETVQEEEPVIEKTNKKAEETEEPLIILKKQPEEKKVEDKKEEIKQEMKEEVLKPTEQEEKISDQDMADYSDETAVITKGLTVKGDLDAEGSINVFGEVEGNIICKGKLMISGTVYGNAEAGELFANSAHITGNIISKGSVKIGQGTIIIGNVTGNSAVIAGAVKGDIDVKGPVVVDSTAIVMGDIKSKSVQINIGAAIEGRCSQCYADVSPTAFFKEN